MDLLIASGISLIALLLFSISIFLLLFVRKVGFSPFVIMNMGLLLETLTLFFPLMGGGEQLASITEVFLCCIAVSLVCVSLYLKGSQIGLKTAWKLEFLFPPSLIMLTLAAITAVCSLLTYHFAGGFPLFVFSHDTATKVTSRSDAFLPFYTNLEWSCGRAMVVLTALSLAGSQIGLAEWIKRHWILVLCSTVGMMLNSLDGMRSTSILGVLIILVALKTRFKIPRSVIVFCLLALSIGFIIIGNIRTGSQELVNFSTSIKMPKWLETSLAWPVSYIEPNLLNLNEIITHPPPELEYGKIFVSQLFPYFISDKLMDVPDDSIQYMSGYGLIYYNGFTFRTMYADLYSDFGYVGSLLVGLGLLLLVATAHNHSKYSPRWLLVYLNFIPAIIFVPFMNEFVFMPNVFPLFLLFVVRKTLKASVATGMKKKSAIGVKQIPLGQHGAI